MQEKRGIPSWVAIVAALVAVALVIALIFRNHQAEQREQTDAATITLHSNNWVKANADLQDARQANINLETQLTDAKTEVTNLTTQVTNLTDNLAKKETELLDVQAALQAAKDEVAKRDARIAELEAQNQTLEKQAADLNVAIANLNIQIDDTRNKLYAAEGDKAALEKELRRLLTEKAELERKFNDLSILRAQVRKLKSELTTAKRLEWLRAGIGTTEPKGAEKLTNTGAAARRKQYDLNVEVKSDGSVKVIPPINEKPQGLGTPEQPIEMK